ncbi:MAG: hypothetical protein WCS42_04660 [Verrucomicrobiota bacterium]
MKTKTHTVDAQHLKRALENAAAKIGKRKRIKLTDAFVIIVEASKI